ncbi:acyl-CoA dehydrogenase family protein [Aquisediminimonas sediminicola]|uniref:acyl-CoA dehydrogenase family protein n=1 Tax=Alteraquisediminimonas sediminicola TaxID=2676787 RepID=UPI001C8EB979|nr:acyl-CoA dehydrogenase family protein [Aquisediminimonas sediminicola]
MSAEPMFFSPLVDTADHHRDLRESVAKLVGKFGRSYFQAHVANGTQPVELWKELGDAGFLGVHIPEEFGGSGGGLAELNIVIEECAAHGCPMLSLVIASICAPIIAGFGSDELKNKWLPGLANGSRKMAFAITEPDAGSNTHKVTTTARKTEKGWVLNGAKYWTSGIDESEAVMVVARDGDIVVEEGRSALSLFVVPTDTPGITLQQIDAAVRTTERQFFVFFDNVELADDALVGERGAGLRQVFVGLNPERVAAAAINNGISRFALSKAAQYARERSVWKSPIGAHQGVAHPLAEAYINVQAARLLAARAADLYDRGEDAAEAANMAKFSAAESSLKALDQAIQTHGGNGLSFEYGLADLWFVARLHKTAPVSREMILNYVAQHSLGLPKSY